MKARFLEDVVVNDKERKLKMSIYKGEVLDAVDAGDFYELTQSTGWRTLAPKDCEGTIFEIEK